MTVTMRLGLQINDIESGYSKNLIQGMSDFCTDHRIHLLVFSGRAFGWPYGYEYQKTAIFGHIHSSNIDALVIASGTQSNYISSEEFARYIESLKPLPIVSISVPIENVPAVLIDNKTSLKTLLEHIVDTHGRKKFMYIGGPSETRDARERLGVFLDFISERSIAVAKSRIFECDYSTQGGIEALRSYFSGHNIDFDVIVCANDNMALGCMAILKEQGFRVPDDVIVTGFDDIPRSRFENPSLTTIAQDNYRQGMIAAEKALALFKGVRCPGHTVVPAHLIVRSSCGCVSTDAQVLGQYYRGQECGVVC